MNKVIICRCNAIRGCENLVYIAMVKILSHVLFTQPFDCLGNTLA